MNQAEDSVRSNHDQGIFSRVYSLTGQTLGKYRLLERLGQGGMAQVYKAYQPDLDRFVAVKVLHPHLTADDEFAERFRREARAIAALEHPHIVRIYDFDTDGALAFLVMEYLQGSSLRERLRELERQSERMSLREVGRIVCALTDALDYAHRRGIVHRDLKPSNVLLTLDGRPVLTDFGIARMIDATLITESGGTLGTPAYMSPEQGQGQPGDARSDIYALGVLLYRLCTGRLPFDADTPYAVILKHITAPLPAPRSLRPDLPEAVERVILKALAKKPEDRQQTAGELGQALQLAIEAPQAATSSPPPGDAPSSEPAAGGVSSGHRSLLARRGPLAVLLPVTATVVAFIALMLITRSFGTQRYLAKHTPISAVAGSLQQLVLSGPEVVEDGWIDPDTPDETWHEADLVHLQGPLTPDRLVLRFDLARLPAAATVTSATLSLHVERWGDQSLPAVAVAYRVLTPWEPNSATYNTPWSKPGLASGIDYDPTPLGMAPLPDAGTLTIDVTRALDAWHRRREPNYGLVIMMSKDSHNQAHHWVCMTEQPDPADRPTLRISYEVAK